LTLVQTSSGNFVKRMILLINWNGINDCFMSHLFFIIDLVFLLLALYLFQHLLYSENYINNEFFSKLSFIKNISLSTRNQYLWIRKQILMAINIG
jgi:hypothetical protein